MAYLPLSTANLPDPVIDPAQGSSPEDYFAGTLYTGNSGSGDNVVDVGFAPDLVWVKSRTQAYPHYLYDKVRGNDLALKSNATDAEATVASFDLTSDGFTLNTTGGSGINEGGQGTNNMMSWNWKAGTSFSNDASATSIGTVDSNGSVSTESGFSIVRFNSGASGTQSFKHGLTQRPDLCIFKEKDSGGSGDHWVVWEGVALNPAQSYGYLNLTNGFANDASQWSNTAPTDSIFTYNSGYAWSTSQEMIAYCFHSVEGFSKFGSYTGNGSADGPFVYTGFRPAWIMWKRTNVSGQSWEILDVERDPYNGVTHYLYPDTSGAENNATGYPQDFLSNGFKIRHTGASANASGGTYIYACFAENPFKYSNAR